MADQITKSGFWALLEVLKSKGALDAADIDHIKGAMERNISDLLSTGSDETATVAEFHRMFDKLKARL
jgi:tellurite resistance protein